MSRKGNSAIVLERCQPARGTSTSRNHRCPARKRERSPDFPQKASASNYQNHSRGAVISIVHPGWCPVTVLSDLLPDAIRFPGSKRKAAPPENGLRAFQDSRAKWLRKQKRRQRAEQRILF